MKKDVPTSPTTSRYELIASSTMLRYMQQRYPASSNNTSTFLPDLDKFSERAFRYESSFKQLVEYTHFSRIFFQELLAIFSLNNNLCIKVELLNSYNFSTVHLLHMRVSLCRVVNIPCSKLTVTGCLPFSLT